MLDGIIMAFSMYTTIPMPNKWNDKNFPYIIANLSIVGIVIGIIWVFLVNIINIFDFSLTIKTAIICVIPLFLSGFIHIDGFMDTCDAIFSRASLEKKYEILKDSRVGAFAVIGFVIISIFYYICMYEILKQNKNINSLIFIPMFSRGFVSIYIMKTNPSLNSGFISSFKKDLKQKHFYIGLILLSFFSILSYLYIGIDLFIIMLLISFILYIYCKRIFQGISGDLCGFIITLTSFIGILYLSL